MASDIAIYFDGGRMHFLHHLTLMSAVRRGHAVTVYARGAVENAPEAVRLADVAEIVDPKRLEAIEGTRLRATVFQYEALAALDIAATLSFDHFLCAESGLEPQEGRLFGWLSDALVGAGVLALPKDSPALAAILEEVRRPPPPDAHLGVWGSQLLTRALGASGEIEAARPQSAFHLLAPDQAHLALKRSKEFGKALSGPTMALPIYHETILPLMRDDFHGAPRYWSVLGAAIRENGVAVRSARAFEEISIPDRFWNKEAPAPPCRDWAPDGAAAPLAPPPTAALSAPPARAAEPAPQAAETEAETPLPETPLKVMIVTTMRNEAPFILEWVAYHRSIGITDFVVYTNDCDDGTDDMLDLLAAKGIVTEHLDNPFRQMENVKPQHAALLDSQSRKATQEADWVIGMDVDEFINIHVGAGTFQDLVNAVPGANMISMTWRLFGNGFVRNFDDSFITETFLHCAHARAPKPHQAWGFKTAFKNNGIYRKFGVHRPKGLNADRAKEINWVDSSGRQMPQSYHQAGWRMSKNNWGYGLVTLNHYSLRSSESYLVKRERGRVNHVDRDQGLAYWFRMNHNSVEDRSILSKLPAAKAEFAKLLADADICAMHERCVSAHGAKISMLIERPDYRSLFEQIESKRMKNLSKMLVNFGNTIFDQGPHAVPDTFLEKADAVDRD